MPHPLYINLFMYPKPPKTNGTPLSELYYRLQLHEFLYSVAVVCKQAYISGRKQCSDWANRLLVYQLMA